MPLFMITVSLIAPIQIQGLPINDNNTGETHMMPPYMRKINAMIQFLQLDLQMMCEYHVKTRLPLKHQKELYVLMPPLIGQQLVEKALLVVKM